MAKRGRVSGQALATMPSIGKDVRLQPPVNLSEAEASVWLELVNDNPAGSFTPTHIPLIEFYCRHVVNAKVIGEEIMAFDMAWLADPDGLKRYDTLLKMAERESRAASSLATRLRITRQVTVHHETAGTAHRNHARSRKPWEING